MCNDVNFKVSEQNSILITFRTEQLKQAFLKDKNSV